MPDEVVYPHDSLAATLASTEAAMRQDEAVKTQERIDAINLKRESLASGDAVPPEKRPI